MKDYLYIYGGKSSTIKPFSNNTSKGMSGLTNGEVYTYFTKAGCGSIEVIIEYLRNAFKKEPDGEFERSIVYLSTELTIDEAESRIAHIGKRRDFLESSASISIIQSIKPDITYRYFSDSLKRATPTDPAGMVIIDSLRNCKGAVMPVGKMPGDHIPDMYKNLCITAERLNVPFVTMSLVRPDYIDQITRMIKISTLGIRNERNIRKAKYYYIWGDMDKDEDIRKYLLSENYPYPWTTYYLSGAGIMPMDTFDIKEVAKKVVEITSCNPDTAKWVYICNNTENCETE